MARLNSRVGCKRRRATGAPRGMIPARYRGNPFREQNSAYRLLRPLLPSAAATFRKGLDMLAGDPAISTTRQERLLIEGLSPNGSGKPHLESMTFDNPVSETGKDMM